MFSRQVVPRSSQRCNQIAAGIRRMQCNYAAARSAPRLRHAHFLRDSGLLDEKEPESTAEALARFNRRPLESKIRVTETSDRYDANVPTCSRPVVDPQNLRQAERATTVESMSSLRSAFGLCASPLWQLVQTVENFLHEGVGWIT